jgi:hypothetical protein
MTLQAKMFVPFLSDVLGVIAFIFLVVRGQRSTSTLVTDQIGKMTGDELTSAEFDGISNFVANVLDVSDMQRRTSLVALVSVGSALTLSDNPKFKGVLVPLLAAWIVLYFVSSQIAPIVTDPSRSNLRECRKRLTILFVVWTVVSVGLKLMSTLGVP